MMPPPLTACPWCFTPLQNSACPVCQVAWVPAEPSPPPVAPVRPPVAPRIAPPARAGPAGAGIPRVAARPGAPPPRIPPKSPRKPESAAKKFGRKVLRQFLPVRLVWIFLIALAYAGHLLDSATGLEALGALLGISAGVDLAIQLGRFTTVRVPDAALAIGAFYLVLVQPGVLTLPLIAILVAGIVIRHAVRLNGHPWFNPTALGLTIGFFLFGTQVPWAVGNSPLDEAVMIVFGLLLILRQRNSWRLPAFFLATVVPLLILTPVLVGKPIALNESNLFVAYLSPFILFFAFFMVPEPRTCPSSPRQAPYFAVLVAVLFVALELLFAEYPVVGPLGAIAPFLALFGGNVYTIVLRLRHRPRPAKKAAARSVPAWSDVRYGAGGMPSFGGWTPPTSPYPLSEPPAAWYQ